MKGSRLLQRLALTIFTIFSLLLTAAATREAFTTVGMPFAGILPFENLYVGAFTQPDWEGGKQGLSYHDRIVAAEGQQIAGSAGWAFEVAAALGEGRPLRATIRNGGSSEVSLRPSFLQPEDAFRIFVPLAGTGLAFLIIGGLVLLITPPPPGSLPFLLYCLLTGIYFLSAYDFHTTHRVPELLLGAFALIPAAVLHLAMGFPRPTAWVGRRKWLRWMPYLLSALLAVPYVGLFRSDPPRWVVFEYAVFGYLSVAYLTWAGVVLHRFRNDPDEEVREQCRAILLPLLPAFGGVFLAGALVFLARWSIPLNYVAPLCLVFPGAVAWAMLRRNLFLVEHLEAQVKKRTAELNEATKLAAVGLLAAGTAHEIGNAMNLISSNLPVLRRYVTRLLGLVKAAPPEADFEFMKGDLPELLSNLEHGASRANDIAADLKAFARPQAGALGEIDLPASLDATIRLLRPEFAPRIEVTTRYDAVPRIQGFVSQIHQVLLNLFLNAIQAIDGPGRIDVAVHAEGDAVVTSISDSGRGITPEQLPRVFEPFFTTRASGTGLGLSVSYGIVQNHGGRLSIESAPGRGTTATMRLPLGPPEGRKE